MYEAGEEGTKQIRDALHGMFSRTSFKRSADLLSSDMSDSSRSREMLADEAGILLGPTTNFKRIFARRASLSKP